MAIQMRRGNYTDFDPNQMVPGEFAVSISDGNKRVFLCFARPGDVIEIPTVESIIDIHEIEELRDEIVAAKEDAEDAADDAESYATSAQTYAGQAQAATITNVTATVDGNVGTPEVTVTKTSTDPDPKTFRFDFKNLKGVKGDTGNKGDTGTTPVITANASVDNNIGTPAVVVTKSGTDEAPVFAFAFSNIKGSQGEKGATGDTGSQGPAGTGFNDAYLDNLNHLILVYTDSTTQIPHTEDVGYVGKQITALTQAEYDALPASTKNDPDLYFWIT